MNRLQRPAQWAILCLVLVALGAAGCSQGPAKVAIHGKVTLNEQPVSDGTIRFIPVDGKTPTPGPDPEIKDGSYEATLPAGSYRVEVHWPKVVRREPMYGPDSPLKDVFEEQMPRKFNIDSKLTRQVEPTTTELNFELKSSD
jgi:hypothetical protein